MKKIFGLLTALLVAVACMTFTSCATDNSGEPAGPSLDGWFISGPFNGWANDPLAASGAVYTATFTADAAETEFAVHNDGWASKYCNGTVIPVGVSTNVKAGGANAKITGLTAGDSYVVTVSSLPAFISVTVVHE